MTSLKNLNLNTFNRPKLPAPRIVPAGKEFESVIRDEVHRTDAEIAVTDAIIDSTPNDSTPSAPPEEANIADESTKLERLVADDFPFDESQLTAVYGLVQQQYGCMIGGAGTGKTTIERKLVDLLQDGLDAVDMSQYWKRGVANEDDDYEIPERLIPSILMCSFTGRSTQMTKKNFPRSWHGNIMTIHRALGFFPEFYMDADAESGELVNKRRFVPSYTAENKMPWDIIIIDEAGMLGLDLWHQLWAACKPTTRIYLIGDINQLPPTHGKSILGFALAKWPTWELTHVHRQQGANNSIVDNAHRVLNGLRPISDSPKPLSLKPDMSVRDPKERMKPMLSTLQFLVQNQDWRFATVEIEEEHKVAAIRIRQMLKLLHGKIYEPNRDFLITPINGFEQTAAGYALGQQPMNQELVTLLNQDSPRYLIDAGREKQNFALGDKVMATVNDYEAGITNGMTGLIKSITINGAYQGDTRRFGKIEDVAAYMQEIDDGLEDDHEDFSLEEMVSDSSIGLEEAKAREKKASGPASHIVEVQFGEGDHAFTVNFTNQSQVASLQLAYAATCHKLQGGEAPLVFVIVHNQHKRPLSREWLYTAITRGSHRVVLLYTKQGVNHALVKQTIRGVNLKAKIASFAALTESGLVGPAMKVRLPAPRSLVTDIEPYQPKEVTHEETKTESSPAAAETRRESPQTVVKIGSLHIHVHESKRETKVSVRDDVFDGDSTVRETVDGGEIVPESRTTRRSPLAGLLKNRTQLAQLGLPAPRPTLVSQMGAAQTAVDLGYHKMMSGRLLEYKPHDGTSDNSNRDTGDSQPVQTPKKVNPLAALLAKQGVKK